MSWFRNLFARRPRPALGAAPAPDADAEAPAAPRADAQPAAAPPAASEFPRRIELVPDQLVAHVHRHELTGKSAAVPCWTYASEGLTRHQQDEIVFTLVRDPARDAASEEGFPQEPLQLLRTLWELAAAGRLVEAGGFTQFGSDGFLGRHLIYTAPRPVPELTLPTPYLTALLVTFDELRLFRELGPVRLLSRLGYHARYFPFPPWSDPGRPGLPLAPTLESSILARTARARARGLSVHKADDTIRLIARPPMGEAWSETLQHLTETPPLALLTDLDAGTDGCLVWEPGQNGAAAITPDRSRGARLGGAFALLVRDQEQDSGLVVEDGFVMMLTSASWKRVLAALTNGEDLDVPASHDGLALAIEWRGAALIEQVELMITEAELEERVDTTALAAFCDQTRRLAEQCFKLTTQQGKVAVHFTCSVDAQRFVLQYQGDAEQHLLQRFHDMVERASPLQVRRGEVSFRICLAISNRRTRS